MSWDEEYEYRQDFYTTDLITPNTEVYEKYKTYDLKVSEYAPVFFKYLRDVDSISKQNLIESFDPARSMSATNMSRREKLEGGRSGAFVYKSSDEKFIIKTITGKELHILVHLLKRLHRFLE
jgi:hypothetical protein